MKSIESLNSAGLPPAILLLILALIWNGKTMETYTDGMMSQVKLIHSAQIMQIEKSERFEARMIEQIGDVKNRVYAIGVSNHMLGLPLYQDNNGKIYLQSDQGVLDARGKQ